MTARTLLPLALLALALAPAALADHRSTYDGRSHDTRVQDHRDGQVLLLRNRYGSDVRYVIDLESPTGALTLRGPGARHANQLVIDRVGWRDSIRIEVVRRGRGRSQRWEEAKVHVLVIDACSGRRIDHFHQVVSIPPDGGYHDGPACGDAPWRGHDGRRDDGWYGRDRRRDDDGRHDR
jgi:hypothetical protein